MMLIAFKDKEDKGMILKSSGSAAYKLPLWCMEIGLYQLENSCYALFPRKVTVCLLYIIGIPYMKARVS